MLDLEKTAEKKDEEEKKDQTFGLRMDQYSKKTLNVSSKYTDIASH